jgi:hypothetical protein
VFLADATAIWQVGRVVPPAGIGNRTRTGHDFLPTPVRRMFLRHTSDSTPTAEDERTRAAPATGTSGPNPRYRTEWLHEDTPAPIAAPASSPGTS